MGPGVSQGSATLTGEQLTGEQFVDGRAGPNLNLLQTVCNGTRTPADVESSPTSESDQA